MITAIWWRTRTLICRYGIFIYLCFASYILIYNLVYKLKNPNYILMELDSLKRFKEKRISDLERMARVDLLEHFVEYLADEIFAMDTRPEIIVLQAEELQPGAVLSYFHSLLRERNIGSQVRASNGEPEPVNGYIVNLDKRVQQYIDAL